LGKRSNERLALKGFLASLVKPEELNLKPTAYDLFMLKILYNPALEAGSDKYETRHDLVDIFENNSQGEK